MQQARPSKAVAASNAPVEMGRLVIIDRLYRQGASPSSIAQFFLEDEKCVEHGYEEGISARNDLSYPAKIHALLPKINKAISALKKRYELDINPETSHNGLVEYVSRLNAIYSQVWLDHDKAFLAQDKNASMKLAGEIAKDIAKAIGVAISPDPKDVAPFGNNYTINNLGELAIMAGRSEGPPIEFGRLQPAKGTNVREEEDDVDVED